MKLRNVVLIIAFFICQASAFRIMYIGNSLTDGINYDKFEAGVESKEGITLEWARDILLGSPLMYHWNEEKQGTSGCIRSNNFTTTTFPFASSSLDDYSYDALTLQPYDWGSTDEATAAFPKVFLKCMAKFVKL